MICGLRNLSLCLQRLNSFVDGRFGGCVEKVSCREFTGDKTNIAINLDGGELNLRGFNY